MAIPGWGDAVSRTAQAWARRRRVVTILMSETKRDDARRSWWKEKLKSSVFVRKFDAALVGGESQRDYLVQLAFPPHQIFLGYDVVDNAYFGQRAATVRSDRASASRLAGGFQLRPFFLAVTRLIERKNVQRLLEAFAFYRYRTTQGKPWDLVICGSGEGEQRTRQTVRDLHLEDCVHLTGFVGYRQIADWYGLAAAFIHPALDEPWGLVVNEACAAGLPILCSQTVGACQDLVKEGENGFLFDPRSKESIANTLIRIHSLSESARRSLGEASQRIVAPFGPERFATNFMEAVDAARERQQTLPRANATAGR